MAPLHSLVLILFISLSSGGMICLWYRYLKSVLSFLFISHFHVFSQPIMMWGWLKDCKMSLQDGVVWLETFLIRCVLLCSCVGFKTALDHGHFKALLFTCKWWRRCGSQVWCKCKLYVLKIKILYSLLSQMMGFVHRLIIQV